MKKRIVLIICFILFACINVNAKVTFKGSDQFYTYLSNGQLVPNDGYIYHYYYGNEKNYNVSINYYDERTNLIETDHPQNDIDLAKGYIKNNNTISNGQYFQGYAFRANCNYSDVWIIESSTISGENIIINLIPYIFDKDVTIYKFLRYGWGFDNENDGYTTLKDDDILLWFLPSNYSNPHLYYNDSHIIINRSDYSNYIKIGYDINDKNNKIDDGFNYYNLSMSGVSGGSSFSIDGFIKPKFTVNCEKNSLKYNESTTCYLKTDYDLSIDKYLIDYSLIQLKIDNFKENNMYNFEQISNKTISLSLRADVDSFFPLFPIGEPVVDYLLEFNITNNNKNVISTETITNNMKIMYNYSGIEMSSNTLFNTDLEPYLFNNYPNITNPKTNKILFVVVIMAILIVISCIIFFILKKKGVLNKV